MLEKPRLEVNNLIKSYGGRRVVDGLSFSVNEGEIVGLLGPNGAGKTTAFYITVGLIRPECGQVYFHGTDITKYPMHKRAKMGMGYLSQEPSIFRHLTVEQNVMCILENQEMRREERKKRLKELLGELHLEALAHKKASTLSGGERRRLEITRSLVTTPSFLLLDEPFANIDPISIFELKQMIRHLSQKGISILITDHNAREIFSIVDRSYIIVDGKVMVSGTVDQLIHNEEVRRCYLGSEFKL